MIEKIESRGWYEIVRPIASGGMGAVFLAKKIGVAGFEKTVAIKMMLKDFAADSGAVDSFIAEAKLVANLIHENIVQIYQLDRCSEGYFFVLEYVDGIPLFDLMEFHRKLGRRLPLNLAVFIAARVARGLAYAHSRRDAEGRNLGIVHCDVCPHNILINSEGVPKITDFGIARVASQQHHLQRGKVAFVAPEQARGEEVDFRADIYSLGIVLFYLLGGGMARNLSCPVEQVLEQACRNEILWERLPADLPPEIRDILKKMLATNPNDRYSDTAELATALEYFIYKDGYGPTIVTLAQYIRKLLPGRFLPVEPTGCECYERTVVLKTSQLVE